MTSVYDPGKVLFNVEPEWVPIDNLHPNDWNVNEMTPEQGEALRRSILQDGLVAQLLECLPDGTIIDGEHRWRILKELGVKKVPVVWSDLSPEEARLATLKRNLLRGEPELAGLGRELVDLKISLGDERLLKDLALSEAELEDLIQLFESSAEQLEELFAGLEPPDNGRLHQMTFVLTQRQMGIVEEALALLRRTVDFSASDNQNLNGNCLERMARDSLNNYGREVKSRA